MTDQPDDLMAALEQSLTDVRDDTIGELVEDGREDVARSRYGDATVDDWFRRVEGVDPDAMREGW